MYKAYLVNDDRRHVLKDEFNAISNAKVTIAQNSIGSFKFSLLPGHDCYERVFPFTSLVQVINAQTEEIVFDGRVLEPLPSMSSKGVVCKSVVCESAEGFLKDSRMPYLEERQWSADAQRTGLQVYIDKVLEIHNAKVEPYKRIYRGEVDLKTHEVSDGVFKGFQRETAHDALYKKLVDVFGGEMRVRRDRDGAYRLDYSERLGRIRGTPIELGRNMQSASRGFKFSDVVTRLTPLGAKLEDSDDRLTVASVNGGVDYIDDEELIATYGVVEGVETWDDVEVPANLLQKGRAFLAANGAISDPLKVSALDLSLIGLEMDSIDLHDWYPCRNPLIGLDETLEVVKKVLDLNSPSKSSVEFGSIAVSQSAAIARAKAAAADAVVSAGDNEKVKPIPVSWLESNVKLGR